MTDNCHENCPYKDILLDRINTNDKRMREAEASISETKTLLKTTIESNIETREFVKQSTETLIKMQVQMDQQDKRAEEMSKGLEGMARSIKDLADEVQKQEDKGKIDVGQLTMDAIKESIKRIIVIALIVIGIGVYAYLSK
jgi:chromosome segregation ATPase